MNTEIIEMNNTFNNWISFERMDGEITGDLVCPNCSDCFKNDPDAVIVVDPDTIKKCIVCGKLVREFSVKQ